MMNKQVRQGFIAKVYGILCIQLAVTFGMVALFQKQSIKDIVQNSRGMYYSAYVCTIAIILVLVCCGNSRRKYPLNYILLSAFTLCEGYMVATIASFYSSTAVVHAVATTFLLVVALTVYAWQTKYDFTTMGGILLAALFSFIIFGWIAAFMCVYPCTTLSTVYACIGAFLFSCYLIYDTQLMVGGRKHELSPDEYVFAALNLYLDIVMLFLYILSLFGNK
jgi:FtsH-binding integral membrane protein